jgi:hypothetical protein
MYPSGHIQEYYNYKILPFLQKKDWLDVIDIYHVYIDWSTLACRKYFGIN